MCIYILYIIYIILYIYYIIYILYYIYYIYNIYTYISQLRPMSLIEAEVLADVPAAEVAVLEDERMAGNMQAGILRGGMLWLL